MVRVSFVTKSGKSVSFNAGGKRKGRGRGRRGGRRSTSGERKVSTKRYKEYYSKPIGPKMPRAKKFKEYYASPIGPQLPLASFGAVKAAEADTMTIAGQTLNRTKAKQKMIVDGREVEF